MLMVENFDKFDEWLAIHLVSLPTFCIRTSIGHNFAHINILWASATLSSLIELLHYMYVCTL